MRAYNAAAVALNPPRPTIDWATVSHYSFIDEFALLQDSRGKICEQPWAKPTGREMLKRMCRVRRAKEQLVRCYVEANRLYTSILDKQYMFAQVLDNLLRGTPLRSAVADFVERRVNVNLRHLVCLERATKHPAFPGDLKRSRWKGSVAGNGAAVGLDDDVGAGDGQRGHNAEGMLPVDHVTRGEVDEDDFVSPEDEDVEGDIGGIIDFVAA